MADTDLDATEYAHVYAMKMAHTVIPGYVYVSDKEYAPIVTSHSFTIFNYTFFIPATVDKDDELSEVL